MPKRSASSTTMIVAFGTSTPTSITVVATSTSSSARAEQLHRHLLLGRRQPPVQQAEPEPRELAGGEALVGLLGRRHLELLALVDQRADHVRLTSGRDLSRTSAHDLRLERAARVAHLVTIGVRPGGSSSSTLTSRSPYTVIAAVRGIGVAVITSRSGTPPDDLSRNAARCSTPNRCCSSTTTAPRLWNVDTLLDQRVRADRDVDRAVGEPGEHRPAVGTADRGW